MPPAWRGRGIGSAMLRWSQRRIRELVRDEQHRGTATFATNVSSTEREADQLIRQDGYHMVQALTTLHERDAPRFACSPMRTTGRARGLYEQLGFRELKQHNFYRKPIVPEPPA